jgi:hypothetical protein
MSANLSKMNNSRSSSLLGRSKYITPLGRDVTVLTYLRLWTQKWTAASWNQGRLSKTTTTP